MSCHQYVILKGKRIYLFNLLTITKTVVFNVGIIWEIMDKYTRYKKISDEARKNRKNIKLDPKVKTCVDKWRDEFVKHENEGVDVSFNTFFMTMYRRRQKYT